MRRVDERLMQQEATKRMTMATLKSTVNPNPNSISFLCVARIELSIDGSCRETAQDTERDMIHSIRFIQLEAARTTLRSKIARHCEPRVNEQVLSIRYNS